MNEKSTPTSIDDEISELARALRAQGRRGFDPSSLVSAAELLGFAQVVGIEGGDPMEQAASLHRLLREASQSLPGEASRAASLLFGFDPRTRGCSLTERRKQAAEELAIGAESFRSHRERRLVDDVSRALLLGATYRRRPDLAAGTGARADRMADRRRVLLIHGTNFAAAHAIAAFLRCLGLDAVAWDEAIAETGLSSPHVADALRAAMDVAQAVVVVLTPDDRVASSMDGDDETGSFVGQPRPNVIFEAGLAYGINPARTVLVKVGNILLPSDVAGVNVLSLSNSAASRNALRLRLEDAGCAVDAASSSWLDVDRGGDFDAVAAALTRESVRQSSDRTSFLKGDRVSYGAVAAAISASPGQALQVTAQLSENWAAQYRLQTQPPVELVEVTLGSLNYLFDIAHERLVGVFGTSSQPTGPRPKTRIRGHPSYNRDPGQQVDRGHVVAHSVGGGVDINLVPQLHALNVSGEWRAFERHAQQHPGTVLLVQLEYSDDSQRPRKFIYGIVRNGELDYREFSNG